MQTVLADLQNTALAIGNTIEQHLGENTETVALLSRYCELLFQAYEKTQQGDFPKEEFRSVWEKKIIAAGSCLLGQEKALTRHILDCLEG